MTMTKMVVKSSQKVVFPDGRDGWCVETVITVMGKDRVIPHFFPHECFAFRAVEYGIDPTDVETLLDIILHENHIPNSDIDPALTAHSGADVADIRKAHIGRCARAKLRLRSSTRAAKAQTVEHPLDTIRAHLSENPIHDDHLNHCRDMIARAKSEGII